MDDFDDENGEGEFIEFLEDLGERKSDSLLNQFGSSKTIKKKKLLINRNVFMACSANGQIVED
ncbi:hypothetical protein CQ056_20465 [Peribacillus simplex]|nr:hypothetical protein CQ056_20465 [Peribacillus simplex]